MPGGGFALIAHKRKWWNGLLNVNRLFIFRRPHLLLHSLLMISGPRCRAAPVR